MTCNQLPTEDLVAWIDGEPTVTPAARVRDHVATCALCARQAALLRAAGDLVAALPRVEPSAGFDERVVSAARAASPRPRGTLRRLLPALAATAAAAALFLAIGDRLGAPTPPGGVLTAREEREIAEDLLVLSNIEALSDAPTAELISLIEDLDLIESLEPEVTGAFEADAREGG